MPLNHKAVIQHARLRQSQVPNDVCQRNTTDDSTGTRSQAPAQRHRIDNVHIRRRGEGPLSRTPQDIERDAGDQVVLRIQADFSSGIAFVGKHTVEGLPGRGGIVCDVDLEVDAQCEADDIEPGANVGGRARDFDDRGHDCNSNLLFVLGWTVDLDVDFLVEVEDFWSAVRLRRGNSSSRECALSGGPLELKFSLRVRRGAVQGHPPVGLRTCNFAFRLPSRTESRRLPCSAPEQRDRCPAPVVSLYRGVVRTCPPYPRSTGAP